MVLHSVAQMMSEVVYIVFNAWLLTCELSYFTMTRNRESNDDGPYRSTDMLWCHEVI